MYNNFSIFYIFYTLFIISSVQSDPDDNSQSQVIYRTAPNSTLNENVTDCYQICGCDSVYVFNATLNECVLNMDYILNTTLMEASKADIEYKNEDHDISNDEGMSKQIRLEAQKIFRGIIVSAIIFVACASLCAISACVYCCHISHSDRKLENEVKALAKKFNKNYTGNKSVRRAPLEPIEESCNVVVGSAGLYVV